MKHPREADLLTELELMALENFIRPWEWSYRHQLLRNTLEQLVNIARYHGYVEPIPPFPPHHFPRIADSKPVSKSSTRTQKARK
jgi:hypothetical protein